PGRTFAARSRNSAESASPLQMRRWITLQLDVPSCSRNGCSIEGTKCKVVTPCDRIVATSWAGSRCAPGAARTKRAPTSSGQKNSQTETSKLNGVFCRTASPALKPYAACIQHKRLCTPEWVLAAPLGWPVEPDVKIA